MAKAKLDSWVVSDAFWDRGAPLVPQRAARPARRKFVRRPGVADANPRMYAWCSRRSCTCCEPVACQRKALPSERFGSASAIHRRFLVWEKAGFFVMLWAEGLAEYDELEVIAWRWQSIDGVLLKAPLAQ